jgi:hypothetical protein
VGLVRREHTYFRFRNLERDIGELGLLLHGPRSRERVRNFLLLAMYLVAIIFEVVALVIGKGWRNRVIVLVGTGALLIPTVGGAWIVGKFN